MQHPVGFHVNPATHRAELTDFGAVLTNKVALITFPHTIAGAFLTAGALVLAVALWHTTRRPDAATPTASLADARLLRDDDTAAFRSAARVGAWTTLIAAAALAVTGDIQGKIMTEVQPMKMAAAEALYHTAQPASFSIFTIGTLNGSRELFSVRLPGLLSFLATGNLHGRVEGIDDLSAQYQATYGPGAYTPVIPVTYWTFRLMIGVGMLAALGALWTLWTGRRGRVPAGRWLARTAAVLPLLPLLGNSFGWIFTEMGRQPWIVFGQLRTAAGVSPGVSAAEVLTSLAVFTVLYGVLAVIEVRLLLRYARADLPDVSPPQPVADDAPLAFAY